LRLKNGGKFTSNEFMDFYGKHGIMRHFLASRTPQQNEVAKRKNTKVREMARTMFKDSKLSGIFW
jgi:transposase InsO family protein